MTDASYTDRLGVTPPDLAGLVERERCGELRLIDLLVALLLDEDRPLAPEEAGERLAELGVRHWRNDLGLALKRSAAPCPEVYRDEMGRFALRVDDPDDLRLKRRLDKLQPPEAPAPAEQQGPSMEELNRRWEEERAASRREAAGLDRVLLYAAPVPEKPRAVGLLDAASREITTFVDDELEEVVKHLAAYDLVIGIAPRELLAKLGISPEGFRFADIDRPQKTRQINKRGRQLRITNELLISGTLSRSRPLGEPKKYRQYLSDGHLGRLRRRLQADVKALWAYYRYGVLHGAVRLRWGFLDEYLAARWGLPGDPSLGTLAEEAREAGKLLEVVAGDPPKWSEPWERTTRVEVVPDGAFGVMLLPLEDGSFERREEIFEARLAEPPESEEGGEEGSVRAHMSFAERDLILEHCLELELEVASRLKIAPVRGQGGIEPRLSLDALDALMGHIAFVANHTEDNSLQKSLDELYDRLQALERRAVS